MPEGLAIALRLPALRYGKGRAILIDALTGLVEPILLPMMNPASGRRDLSERRLQARKRCHAAGR